MTDSIEVPFTEEIDSRTLHGCSESRDVDYDFDSIPGKSSCKE